MPVSKYTNAKSPPAPNTYMQGFLDQHFTNHWDELARCAPYRAVRPLAFAMLCLLQSMGSPGGEWKGAGKIGYPIYDSGLHSSLHVGK